VPEVDAVDEEGAGAAAGADGAAEPGDSLVFAGSLVSDDFDSLPDSEADSELFGA
jgi:hypothetical protein